VLVLAEVFAEALPDFGMMMSSLSSVLGGTGHAGDAAANRFLDAQSSGMGGLVSINWEGWAFPDTGPVSGSCTRDRLGMRQPSLSPEQGGDILDLILRSDVPSRLAVSATDLERRIQQSVRPKPDR
jgi:hypothetical protein